jgi:Type IV secretory pathway, VirD4 components
MKNYAGHRLAPWLSHLMVSRSETARALLTPGEIMQVPPTDEIVMVAGTPPIRATKARYCEDARFTERVLPPPDLVDVGASGEDDWSRLAVPAQDEEPGRVSETGPEDEEDGAIRNRRIMQQMRGIARQVWLATTPALPELAAKGARSKAGERYEAFIVALGRRLAQGPKLRQEVSEDVWTWVAGSERE